jgi:hypothetical protein
MSRLFQVMFGATCCYWQRYIRPSSSFVRLPGWHLMKLRPE